MFALTLFLPLSPLPHKIRLNAIPQRLPTFGKLHINSDIPDTEMVRVHYLPKILLCSTDGRSVHI
ncbi:MAG: hypothetical protein LBM87_07495 [Ruminococcus sp.]|nr:hypothetical protein [Ruminococcus sp.]